MELNKEFFKIIAPELASTPNSTLNVLEEAAKEMVSEKFFGKKCDQAITYLVAHMLTVSKRKGNAGAIASKKVGDLAVSYNAGTVSGSLDSTSYGQEYLRIRKAMVKGPVLSC